MENVFIYLILDRKTKPSSSTSSEISSNLKNPLKYESTNIQTSSSSTLPTNELSDSITPNSDLSLIESNDTDSLNKIVEDDSESDPDLTITPTDVKGKSKKISKPKPMKRKSILFLHYRITQIK